MASSQCISPRKYSIDFVGMTFSIRTGMMATPLLAARSISRRTCDESFAFDEKIRTITRHRSMASMIAAAYSRPGEMSRGATQQRIPAASSTAQAASATVLSAVA